MQALPDGQHLAIPATLPSSSAPAKPTSKPSPEEVMLLVHRLTDGVPAVREAATNSLLAMAEVAEPLLKQLLTTSLTDETRSQVEAALKMVDDDLLIRPTVITLHCHDTPLKFVLMDFASQAGSDLGTGSQGVGWYCRNSTISVDLDRVSIWQALCVIREKAGMSLFQDGAYGEKRMSLRPGKDVALDQCIESDKGVIAGPFLLVPFYCSFNSAVRYGKKDGEASSKLSLMVMIVAEPKLHIVGGFNNDWVTQAFDENGQSLLSTEEQSRFYRVDGPFGPLMYDFKLTPSTGKMIAKLKGELKIRVQTKSTLLEFDDLTKKDSVTHTVAGVTITCKPMVKTSGWDHFPLTIVAPGFDRAKLQSMLDSAYITEDKHGGPRKFLNNHMPADVSPEHTDVTLDIGDVGDTNPARLYMQVPVEVRQISVPYEIDDLPLPKLTAGK